MYINIHTHQTDGRNDVKSIVNLSPCEQTVPNEGLFSVGVHPWSVDSLFPAKLANICHILQQKDVVAIGEIGLDKLSENGYEFQESVFETQIKMANLLQKPIIIHCVKAYNELIRFKGMMTTPAIIHGFRGKPQLMEDLCHVGFYISFGNKFNEESLLKTPINRLFFETDNDKNADIKELYNYAAKIKNCTSSELEVQTEKNFRTIFS